MLVRTIRSPIFWWELQALECRLTTSSHSWVTSQQALSSMVMQLNSALFGTIMQICPSKICSLRLFTHLSTRANTLGITVPHLDLKSQTPPLTLLTVEDNGLGSTVESSAGSKLHLNFTRNAPNLSMSNTSRISAVMFSIST
jgi:hypothetical protein